MDDWNALVVGFLTVNTRSKTSDGRDVAVMDYLIETRNWFESGLHFDSAVHRPME